MTLSLDPISSCKSSDPTSFSFLCQDGAVQEALLKFELGLLRFDLLGAQFPLRKVKEQDKSQCQKKHQADAYCQEDGNFTEVQSRDF